MGSMLSSSKGDCEKPLPLLCRDNPGTMEDLFKKCKDVYPANFEGARINIQKCLSSFFHVSHAISLSSLTPSGYRFGATYVCENENGPNESFPVLMGDIDPNGNLNANIYHKLSDRLSAKFVGQLQSRDLSALSVVTDYRGDDYTASMTIANPTATADTIVLVGHYLQTVTPRVALGAELAYQRSSRIIGNQIAMLSLAGRYVGDDFQVAGTVGGSGLHICYYQRASEQLQLGVEWETNLRMQESSASIGYQIDLPKADLVFKGMVDSNFNIGSTLEKKLAPLPFTLTISGMLNHAKNQFRLGLGMLVG